MKKTLEEINEIEYFNGYSNISVFSTGGGCYEVFASLSDNLWYMGDCLEGGLYVDCNPNLALDNEQCFCTEWQDEHEVYMPTDEECKTIIYSILNLFKETYNPDSDDDDIIDYENCNINLFDLDNIIERLREGALIMNNTQVKGNMVWTVRGYKYISKTGLHYGLYEGITVGGSATIGHCTSDMCFIIFDGDGKEDIDTRFDYSTRFVDFLYGVSALKEHTIGSKAFADYVEMIAYSVNKYEQDILGIPTYTKTEIDLGGPTDCLIEYFVNKLSVDMYCNRDTSNIPCMASINAEVLGKICERAFADDCHFFLCVDTDDRYDDNINYCWNIVDTFAEVVENRDKYCEVYEIIVDGDPELYQIKF